MVALFGKCDCCGIVGEVFEVMLPDEAGTIEHWCEDCWENDD